jgi:hypothetical protein
VAATHAQHGLSRDHQLVVGDGHEQAVLGQPGGGGRIGVAGVAPVADAHDGERSGGAQRLVEQPPGGLVGPGEQLGDHPRVGQRGGHGRDQLGLAGLAFQAEGAGHLFELVAPDPDPGQLGH